jgi:geranylgeranyl pyrophosphate synthase
MKNDLADIHDCPHTRHKGIIGEDLFEWKTTLMAIKTLELADEKAKKRYMEIITSKTRDQEVLFEGMKIMRDCGAVDYHQKKIEQYRNSRCTAPP